MLNLSVSHIPGTVDIYPLDGRMHVRFRVQRGLLKGASLIYNSNKNLWHEFRDEAPMALTHTDSELEYSSVSVPLTDTRFAYIFALSCKDGTAWYLSEEGLSQRVLEASVQAIAAADVLVIGGTSLVVYPAAGLVRYYGGSKLVVINKTPLENAGADLTVIGAIGEVLGAV